MAASTARQCRRREVDSTHSVSRYQASSRESGCDMAVTLAQRSALDPARVHGGSAQALPMEKFVIDGGVPLRGTIVPGRQQERRAADPRRLGPDRATRSSSATSRGSATSRRCSSVLGARRHASTGATTTRSRSARPAWTGRARRPRAAPSASARRSCSPARCWRASGAPSMPPPGGDVIGRRRLDPHLDAFSCLGATFEHHARHRHRGAGRAARRRRLHGRAVRDGDRERADGRRAHARHDRDRQRRLRAARPGPRADAREDGRRHRAASARTS